MPLDVAAALKFASPNSVVKIPAGEYGDVAINSVDRSSGPVTVRPLERANPPIFRTFAMNGCAGLFVEDLKVRLTPTRDVQSHTPIVLINRCRGVRLLRPDIRGGDAVEGSPEDIDVRAERKDTIIGFPVGRGIHVDGSMMVSIERANVRTCARGIVLTSSQDVRLLDVDVSDIRLEHITLVSVEDVLIQRHHLRTARPWKWGQPGGYGGDHGDFIHAWTEDGKGPNRNVRILDGLIDAADGFPIMGIFLEDRLQSARGGSFGYPGLEIRGNTILGGNAQGISMMNPQGLVADNLLLQTSGDPKSAPSVLLEGDGRHEVIFYGNRSHDVYGTLLVKKSGPSTYGGDAKIATTPAMIVEARKTWMAKYRPAATAPAPPVLRAKPG